MSALTTDDEGLRDPEDYSMEEFSRLVNADHELVHRQQARANPKKRGSPTTVPSDNIKPHDDKRQEVRHRVTPTPPFIRRAHDEKKTVPPTPPKKKKAEVKAEVETPEPKPYSGRKLPFASIGFDDLVVPGEEVEGEEIDSYPNFDKPDRNWLRRAVSLSEEEEDDDDELGDIEEAFAENELELRDVLTDDLLNAAELLNRMDEGELSVDQMNKAGEELHHYIASLRVTEKQARANAEVLEGRLKGSTVIGPQRKKKQLTNHIKIKF